MRPADLHMSIFILHIDSTSIAIIIAIVRSIDINCIEILISIPGYRNILRGFCAIFWAWKRLSRVRLYCNTVVCQSHAHSLNQRHEPVHTLVPTDCNGQPRDRDGLDCTPARYRCTGPTPEQRQLEHYLRGYIGDGAVQNHERLNHVLHCGESRGGLLSA